GYGEAENQLENKHPDRFNLGGCIRWQGRVYLAYQRTSKLMRPFVYHGRLGTGLFQTLYQKDPSTLPDAPAMVQWYVGALALIAFGAVSPWPAFFGGAMLLLSLWVALIKGLTTEVPVRLDARQTFEKVVKVTLLYFLFPLARGYGRWAARGRHQGWL